MLNKIEVMYAGASNRIILSISMKHLSRIRTRPKNRSAG